MYLSSYTCAACTGTKKCDGISRSDCNTGNSATAYQIEQDGSCYNLPDGYRAPSQAVTGLTSITAGKRRTQRNAQSDCTAGNMCIKWS